MVHAFNLTQKAESGGRLPWLGQPGVPGHPGLHRRGKKVLVKVTHGHSSEATRLLCRVCFLSLHLLLHPSLLPVLPPFPLKDTNLFSCNSWSQWQDTVSAGLPWRCPSAGSTALWRLHRGAVFLSFSASWTHIYYLAHGPFFVSKAAVVFNIFPVSYHRTVSLVSLSLVDLRSTQTVKSSGFPYILVL